MVMTKPNGTGIELASNPCCAIICSIPAPDAIPTTSLKDMKQKTEYATDAVTSIKAFHLRRWEKDFMEAPMMSRDETKYISDTVIFCEVGYETFLILSALARVFVEDL